MPHEIFFLTMMNHHFYYSKNKRPAFIISLNYFGFLMCKQLRQKVIFLQTPSHRDFEDYDYAHSREESHRPFNGSGAGGGADSAEDSRDSKSDIVILHPGPAWALLKRNGLVVMRPPPSQGSEQGSEGTPYVPSAGEIPDALEPQSSLRKKHSQPFLLHVTYIYIGVCTRVLHI